MVSSIFLLSGSKTSRAGPIPRGLLTVTFYIAHGRIEVSPEMRFTRVRRPSDISTLVR